MLPPRFPFFTATCHYLSFFTFWSLLSTLTLTQARPVPEPHANHVLLPSITHKTSILEQLTDGWTSVIVTVFISIPWLVIGVFDAIDSKYRSSQRVAMRLSLATSFLICAYTLGICYVIGLIQQMDGRLEEGRYDEVATILVLLFFNMWHVSRNIRGWTQFIAIKKSLAVFLEMQTRFAQTYPRAQRNPVDQNSKYYHPNGFNHDDDLTSAKSSQHGALSTSSALTHPPQPCIQGLERLQISNRLIDNDIQTTTPFLSPLFRMRPFENPAFPKKQEDAWAIAVWRAWWTQDVSQPPDEDCPDLTAPPGFRCDRAHRQPLVHDLMWSQPSALTAGRAVHDQATGAVIRTADSWKEALRVYGGSEGQQDTHGEDLPPVASVFNASGIALLVREKTRFVPHRMSALWYATARFEEVYDGRAFDSKMRADCGHVMLPKWGGWINIARGIAEDGISALSITDRTITLLAGELASASLILVRYADRYRDLVDQIHRDGLNARWTFGWSGLLACFSHLWTRERIYIAMLNGLSLLALTLSSDVATMDPNVRAMLYGYAAFAVSDRAVGRITAQDRKAELDRRYKDNKGKTCRGSGLCATRIACEKLGLPAEASHMDGLPSFSTGWAGEFLERKPGNQDPEHGLNHNEVEAKQGSSNVFRYPYSHS